MNRTTLHDLKCPACQRTLWGSTAISSPQSSPAPGDATVCDGCGAIMVLCQRCIRIAAASDFEGESDKALLLLSMWGEVRAGAGRRRPAEGFVRFNPGHHLQGWAFQRPVNPDPTWTLFAVRSAFGPGVMVELVFFDWGFGIAWVTR